MVNRRGLPHTGAENGTGCSNGSAPRLDGPAAGMGAVGLGAYLVAERHAFELLAQAVEGHPPCPGRSATAAGRPG